MPARSPHRHSPVPAPPAPPRISRRTSPIPVKRGRSLERRGVSSAPGQSRRREFREGSPRQSRRSRSPMRRGGPKGPTGRNFPDSKRKLSPPPPKKSRREGRRPISSPEVKQTRSKSPVGRDRGSRPFGNAPGSSAGYSATPNEGPNRLTRTVGSSDRFRGSTDYEEEAALDRPIFRGPEGTVRFDPNELKRISVEIVRRNLLPPESQVINRAIVNPEDITPVRRPEVDYGDKMSQPPHGRMREPPPQHSPPHHRSHPNDRPPSPSPWGWNHSSAVDNYSQHDRMGYPNRERSRIRSPGPREPHGYPYPEREREHSPYDSRSHPRDFVDSREKRGDRYHSSRDDLRHELDQRRRDDPPPPHYRQTEMREGGGSYNRPRDVESDLRTRISEKRSDPIFKHDDRDRERDRERERHEMERERHRSNRSPVPPPSRDRRRGSPDMGPSRYLDKEARDRELWEREREKERERDRDGTDRKRRGRSRELEDERRAGGSRRHSSVERFSEPSSERKERKPEFDYDQHSGDRGFFEREDFSVASRGGRGALSVRRPMPHPGARGMPPRFRPPVMAMRVPPFIPVRGGFRPHLPRAFSPRIGFFPPPFRPFFM